MPLASFPFPLFFLVITKVAKDNINLIRHYYFPGVNGFGSEQVTFEIVIVGKFGSTFFLIQLISARLPPSLAPSLPTGVMMTSAHAWRV